VRLLPGNHLLSTAGGGQVAFTVDAQGNLTWDSSLNGILASPARGQLTVNGETVTIDARALSSPSVAVDYYTSKATNSVFPLTLLPGSHELTAAGATISFTLNPDGTITFPASEDNDLSSPGPDDLVVKAIV
jgi:hypothetical protein